jgi:hypothetical protein
MHARGWFRERDDRLAPQLSLQTVHVRDMLLTFLPGNALGWRTVGSIAISCGSDVGLGQPAFFQSRRDDIAQASMPPLATSTR